MLQKYILVVKECLQKNNSHFSISSPLSSKSENQNLCFHWLFKNNIPKFLSFSTTYSSTLSISGVEDTEETHLMGLDQPRLKRTETEF